ncbi:MAG: hypothetical protein AAFQ09_10935 [Pseudomonadota bacterium]
MKPGPVTHELRNHIMSLPGLQGYLRAFDKVITHRRGVALLKGQNDGQDVGLKLVLPDAQPTGPYHPVEILSREARWLGKYGRAVGATYALDDGIGRGENWLLMRWLPGAPADRWWRGPEKTTDIFAVMAQRVTAIHALGQVHGDLQPAHFLIADNDVAMIDFGLAHRPGSFKYRGAMIHFLAPEIAAALVNDKPALLDPLAEVYSFAAVVYFIVTGKLPTPYPGASGKEKLQSIAQNGCKTPEALAEHLPAQIAQCFGKCLSHSRAERIQSMDDLITALPAGRSSLGQMLEI